MQHYGARGSGRKRVHGFEYVKAAARGSQNEWLGGSSSSLQQVSLVQNDRDGVGACRLIAACHARQPCLFESRRNGRASLPRGPYGAQARDISSYEELVQDPIKPTLSSCGQSFFLTSSANLEIGVPKSGVNGPLM